VPSVLVLALIIAAPILGLFWLRRVAASRRALRRSALEELLPDASFSPGPIDITTEPFTDFDAFHLGEQAFARNVTQAQLRSRHGSYALLAGDYDYTLPGLDRAVGQERGFSFVLAQPTGSALSRLVLRPRTITDAAAALVGGGGIAVGDPALERRFVIQCPEPERASALLGPDVTRLLAAAPSHAVYISNGWILLRSHQIPWSPQELALAVDWIRNLLDQWPRAFEPRSGHDTPTPDSQ
jgi:hypothetical protein